MVVTLNEGPVVAAGGEGRRRWDVAKMFKMFPFTKVPGPVFVWLTVSFGSLGDCSVTRQVLCG